ncbi:hypothetical protein WJX72_004114 [[Myrmecia] bisecta]|uniref:Plastid lipid-associated protein/fibrillin conserved domain-containing protein n=1 Tax=[Myrmecia] bisecta TaxID=41462 RepID=A0AAW1QR40_9CHLO
MITRNRLAPVPPVLNVPSVTAAKARSGPPLAYRQTAVARGPELPAHQTVVSRRALLATAVPTLSSSQDLGLASQPGSGGLANEEAKAQVLRLLAQGRSNYNQGPDLGPAVDRLIATNPTPSPGVATMTLGQGTWEVFYAPHIARLSAALGTRFEPLRYILRGDAIYSNVRYTSPLLGTGWLSASGSFSTKDADTVTLNFDRFWVDRGSKPLRPELPDESARWDAVVGALGRLSFLPQFAVFPVLYLDDDLAVFSSWHHTATSAPELYRPEKPPAAELLPTGLFPAAA